MLQKKCVSKSLLTLLNELQQAAIFRDYFLVGGMSLALQIGHRRSEDIDLFTQNEIDKEAIGVFLLEDMFDCYKINKVRPFGEGKFFRQFHGLPVFRGDADHRRKGFIHKC
jgi:hypothetical protein